MQVETLEYDVKTKKARIVRKTYPDFTSQTEIEIDLTKLNELIQLLPQIKKLLTTKTGVV